MRCRISVLALVALGLASPVAAQDGSNVLIVLNAARAGSEEIGARYAKARAVPSENVLRVTTETEDEIERLRFDREIKRPIADWIIRHDAQDRILYLLLIKGVPLRVKGSAGRTGTVASVDSELTLLYRELTGVTSPTSGPIPNPYFHGDRSLPEAKPFSHATHDIYLVSRLDGFTDADVLQLIDRAASAGRNGEFILDQKTSLAGEQIGDAWLGATARALGAAGLAERVVLDFTRDVLTGRKQVLGYASWGSNDPAIRTRQFNLEFAPGALAAMFVSTDARTFKEPPPAWSVGTGRDPNTFFEGSPQSLIGDLIREGVTGVAGQVAEPYLDGTIRPQVLFPAYVSGFNLVEAFYLAMPYLSWQTVVVGDPLCGPFRSAGLTAAEGSPALNPETEMSTFFSTRRLAQLEKRGVAPAVAKLLLKAQARLAHDDRAGARQALESATTADPAFVLAHSMLAAIYEETREYDDAIEQHRAILRLTPNNLVSLNNLAYALAVRKGAPAEGLPLAQRAYTLASGNPSIADTLGWIRHLLGSEAEAEKLLISAANADPENAETHLHLAHVYAALKRQDVALVELNKAVQLDSSLDGRDDVKALRASLGR